MSNPLNQAYFYKKKMFIRGYEKNSLNLFVAMKP